jgi:hypothetical protein
MDVDPGFRQYVCERLSPFQTLSLLTALASALVANGQ